MKWLLWREYRRNRLLLLSGTVLAALPYLFAFAINDFYKMAIWSLGLSNMTAALLGGNAIAGERADRSAEFLAYLPVSRLRLFVGKLSLAAATTVVIWGGNLLLLWILTTLNPYSSSGRQTVQWGYLVLSYLTIFGVAWSISSFQSSAVFAVCGGLITPLLVTMGLQSAAYAFKLTSIENQHWTLYTVICTSLGVIGFAAGTWYYFEPIEG